MNTRPSQSCQYLRSLLCLVLFSCSIGCGITPNSQSSQAGQSISLASTYGTGQNVTLEVTSGIRQLFQSPQLNQYLDKAIKQNPSLKLAKARIEEAGFNIRKSEASALPQLNGSSSVARRGNKNNSNSNFELGLDTNWEPDIWGKTQASIQASSAQRDSQIYLFHAAKQSLTAQVAQSWIQLISREKILQLAGRRLDSLQDSHDLIQRRFENGLESLGNLNLAQTDLSNAKATAALRLDQRDIAARSLQTLTGVQASTKPSATQWPSLTRSVRAGAPSSLLLSRPDIKASYQSIVEADARVNVAYKDLFPSFPLTASLGQSSSQLKQLANSNFSTWSIVANLTAPLIDGGQRKAELGAANKRAEQALYRYQETVLSALEEVENALGSEQLLKEREEHTQSALEAAIQAETNTRRSYENGLVEVLTLLDATRRRLSTEENLIEIQASRYNNRISLALAVGKAI